MPISFLPRVLTSLFWRPTTPLLSSGSLSLARLSAGLDDGRRQALENVRQLSLESGLAVFLVGGPVRDALLDAPVLDLDFSVEGGALRLAGMLADRMDGDVTVHDRFRTATVVFGDIRVDLVTARRESYRNPGHLPDVTPGGVFDDLARRDFAINAMALPVSGDRGLLIDPHGGVQDLERGIVRALHTRSFIDDPTRMLRAVRYEQRFGFSIEDGTRECLASAISAGHMDAVSGDRWRHELKRILEEVKPGPALLRADELGLLAALHRSLADSSGVRRLAERDDGQTMAQDWLAALFAPLSTGEVDAVISRLRLSGRWATLARDTIALRDTEIEISRSAHRPSELYRMLSPFDLGAVTSWARLTRYPVVAEALNLFVKELRFVRPVISGATLMEMGAPQGPLVGRILARLRDARLDGVVTEEREERTLALALMSQNREMAVK